MKVTLTVTERAIRIKGKYNSELVERMRKMRVWCQTRRCGKVEYDKAKGEWLVSTDYKTLDEIKEIVMDCYMCDESEIEIAGVNPLADYSDDEILAEARRRGLI